MFKSYIKSFFEKGNVIRIELDNWHKWYKEPAKLHNEVVSYLIKKGKNVDTISIADKVHSNEISKLLIDGEEYTLSIRNVTYLASTQEILLRKSTN